jgi:hypothetical protein
MGFYDKQNKQKKALAYYNTSVRKVTADDYLVGSNYRNIGDMYFKNKVSRCGSVLR